MDINRICKPYKLVNQCKLKNRGITVLYLYYSKNQLTTTSQNKWKEGWIKSDENWKQTWINSALNFICSANPNDSKLNFSQANEFRKLTKKAVGKRIRDSLAQDSSKCQNWKLQTVGIWIGERCSCSGTKLQFPREHMICVQKLL